MFSDERAMELAMTPPRPERASRRLCNCHCLVPLGRRWTAVLSGLAAWSRGRGGGRHGDGCDVSVSRQARGVGMSGHRSGPVQKVPLAATRSGDC